MNTDLSNQTNPARSQSIEQRRAQYALEKINQIKACDFRDKYRSYVVSLPAQIQLNGLGQSIAFIYSKKNASNLEAKAYGKLYQHMSQWICDSDNNGIYFQIETSNDLMESLVNNDMQKYQLVTVELQALLVWLKKFARALINNNN